MHEKNKYRHIPWNRYNLEKYRDINFWSYRPALQCHRRWHSVRGSLKNHLFLTINLKNLNSPQRTFCETERFFRCKRFFMGPFRQKCSSMASWSTFILKSVSVCLSVCCTMSVCLTEITAFLLFPVKALTIWSCKSKSTHTVKATKVLMYFIPFIDVELKRS